MWQGRALSDVAYLLLINQSVLNIFEYLNIQISEYSNISIQIFFIL